MKKSQKILLGVGAGVLVIGVAAAIGGPLLYRALSAAPDDVPSLNADAKALEPGESAPATGDESAVGPIDAATLAGSWTVTDGSEAGYRVDEVLNGTDVTVTGRTPDVQGTLTVADDGLSLEAAEITVDVASITTDSAQRDGYFRSTALRTDEFPTATFALTEPVAFDAAPALGEVVKTEATGDLTIAGVTRSVTASVEVRGTSDGSGDPGTATGAEIAGAIPISFADFGVEAPSLGFVSVEDSGSVEFQLVATRD